jgi:anti-sigma B factor antagonist
VRFELSDHTVDSETHVIELGGQVDLYSAPEFTQRMAEVIDEGKTRVVVDFSRATFIDSTALGMLVAGVKRLRLWGGSLALVVTDENLIEPFEITGLYRAFSIHRTRDEALADVSAHGDAQS